jgi:hypothetical protein
LLRSTESIINTEYGGVFFMRKLYFTLIFLIAIIFSVSTISYAAVTIQESTDMKININGEVGTYADVPIVIGGRSLLPLRAMLVNLGIKDDNDHIIWDGTKKTVTILKDEIKINLEVENKQAYVNGVKVDLDIAPVIYKSRVYIPAAFIAQSLGKKVVWDASMKMVLIRDEGEFNEVKSILEKTGTAMNSVIKYKSSKDTQLAICGKNQKMTYEISVKDQIDNKEKTWYGDTKRTEVSSDGKNLITNLQFLLRNNTAYTRIPPEEKWNRIESLTQEQFNNQFNQGVIKPNDINCAGLICKNNTLSNEILLSGKISLDEVLGNYMDMLGVDKYTLTGAQVEISIDKTTLLVNSLNLKINGSMPMKLDNMKFTSELNFVFSDYNGDFEIILPDT